MNLLHGKLINHASQFETYKAHLHKDLLEVVASMKADAIRRFVDYDAITAKVCERGRGRGGEGREREKKRAGRGGEMENVCVHDCYVGRNE